MPRMKTNKAIAKRMKITARGKVKRYGMGRKHLLSAKTTKRKRHLRRPRLITGADVKKMKIALPYA